MIYKREWEQAQQRTLAWWEGEAIDRVCLQVTAPRSDTIDDPSLPDPADLDAHWTDVDSVLARGADTTRRTFCGGEAFPLFRPNLGPDAFAAFFGAPLEFLDRRTTWVPLLKRIQAGGKSLHLSVWPHEVRTLIEELQPEGLMLQRQVGSESEARDLLGKVAAWSA